MSIDIITENLKMTRLPCRCIDDIDETKGTPKLVRVKREAATEQTFKEKYLVDPRGRPQLAPSTSAKSIVFIHMCTV
jgi:hypothetical protein